MNKTNIEELIVLEKWRLEGLLKETKELNVKGGTEKFTIALLEAILEYSKPLEPIVSESFDAGNSFAIGSHKDFEQTHPNKQEYLKTFNL
jgi:hypothetical protein